MKVLKMSLNNQMILTVPYTLNEVDDFVVLLSRLIGPYILRKTIGLDLNLKHISTIEVVFEDID